MSKVEILAIEGADRTGKATLSKNLQKRFEARGTRTKLIEVPYNDMVTHKLIYWMLKKKYAKTLPNLFQFVQFVNKFIFQFYLFYFLAFKEHTKYDMIILDRWKTSSLVYGKVGGASKFFISLLSLFLIDADMTIVIGDKTHFRNEVKDVYEKDNDFQRSVKDEYKKSVSAFNDHYYVDNDCSASELELKAFAKIVTFEMLNHKSIY